MEEQLDTADAELEAKPYDNITARVHRRASSTLKETLGSIYDNQDDSNLSVCFDDRQTIASSGICSSDPSVVQEEKLLKT